VIPREEWRTGMVGGKEEVLLSASGVLILAYLGWVDDHLPKCKESLERYCNYLNWQGYKGTALGLLNALMVMERDSAIQWLRLTCQEYCLDEMEAMSLVLGANIVEE